MLTCKELDAFVVDYLGGDLAEDKRAAFDAHIKNCNACRSFLTSYKASIMLGKSVFEDISAPAPEDIPDELVEAVLKARRQS